MSLSKQERAEQAEQMRIQAEAQAEARAKAKADAEELVRIKAEEKRIAQEKLDRQKKEQDEAFIQWQKSVGYNPADQSHVLDFEPATNMFVFSIIQAKYLYQERAEDLFDD